MQDNLTSGDEMDASKKKKLEAAGWKVGNAKEFLGLSPSEQEYIELKLELAKILSKARQENKLTQTQLAKKIKSSQSRVAKMEAGDASVSLDLLVRSLLELNVSRSYVVKSIHTHATQGSKKLV